MKRILYLIPLVCIFFACQPNDMLEGDADIYLSASVEGAIETRGPYVSTPTPTPSEVLHAAVWATNIGSYQNKGWDGKTKGDKDKVAIYGTADFDDGQPKLLNYAVYPSSGVAVDFIGLHPNTAWSTQDGEGKVAEFTFDGSHDVMFAPKSTGTYASDNNANILTLNFQHLLTWLKIKIKAESDMVAKSWGKVLEMKVSSSNKVSVDLMHDYSFDACVSFSGDDRVSLHKIGSDEIFPTGGGFELTNTTDYREEAYVLCQPVVATKDYMGEPTSEYTLYIKTERRDVSLPIDLKRNATECFEGSTRARHFTLNLNFMVGNIVTVEAEVTDWIEGSSMDMDVDF